MRLYTASFGGGTGNDIIKGKSGGDFLGGGTGSDRIYGGGGADVIGGSHGNDLLYEGPAARPSRLPPAQRPVTTSTAAVRH